MPSIRRSSREPSVPRARKSHTIRAVGRAKTPPKKKTYKSVFVEVNAPKKRLRWSETSGQAPDGFTFVPYGNPTLTEYCRTECTRRNLWVYIVKAESWNPSAADPTKISNYTHRVGHHFPTDVVRQAIRQLDLELCKTTGIWVPRTSTHLRESSKETEAEIAAGIREVFPFIPDEDVLSIAKHAFKDGTARVGTQSNVRLSRRVQLAVSAHIRHTYTDYDNLLKHTTWRYARNTVEPQSIAVMKKWRGEDDLSDETEDMFREFLVIDDGDDDEDDGGDEETTDMDEVSNELQLVATPRAAHELEDDYGEDVRWLDNPGRLEHEEGKIFLLRPIHELNENAYLRPKGSQAGPPYHAPAKQNVAYGHASTARNQPELVPHVHHERVYHLDGGLVENRGRLHLVQETHPQPPLQTYSGPGVHERVYHLDGGLMETRDRPHRVQETRLQPLQSHSVSRRREPTYLDTDEELGDLRRPCLPHDGKLGLRGGLLENRDRPRKVLETRPQPPLHSHGVPRVREPTYLHMDEELGDRRRPRLPHDGNLGLREQSYVPNAGGVYEPNLVVDSGGAMYRLHPIVEVDDTHEQYRGSVVPLPRSTSRQYDMHHGGRRDPRQVPAEDRVLPSVGEFEVIDLTASPSPPRRTRARRF